MLKRKIYLAIIFLIVIALTSCMGKVKLTEDATPEDYKRADYYETLRLFNDVHEDYLDAYDVAAPEVKAKWKKELDPWFKRVRGALNAWGASVGSATENEKRDAYMNLYDELTGLLLQYGIVEIKKEGQ